MKIKHNIEFLILIIFLRTLLGCSEDIDTKNTILIDNAERLIADQLIEMIDEIQLIKVDTTNALFGNIRKVVEHNGIIYLLHGTRKKQIAAFNEYGSFFLTLDHIGKGPGEYKQITDFDINTDEQWILVLDVTQRKVIFYDLDGSFIKEQRINFFADKIAYFQGDYFFYTLLMDNKTAKGKEILVLDADFKLVNSFIDYDPGTRMKLSTFNVFSKSEDNLYFSNIFKDSIFIIDKWKSELFKKVLTEDNPMPRECWGDNRLYNKHFAQSKFYMGCFHIVYPNVMFYVMDKHKEHIHIYNIQSGQNYYSEMLNIYDHIYLREPKGVGEDGFYFSRQADWILDKKDEWSEFLKKMDCSSGLEIISRLAPNDNPILIKVKLKDQI